MSVNSLFTSIFDIQDSSAFNAKSAEIFSFQYKNNPVYHQYVNLLGQAHAPQPQHSHFPLLPISSFKRHTVFANELTAEVVFTSSSTTGSTPSRHSVHTLQMYERTYTACFNKFYGSPADWCILALLPSYLEREGSSLIEMCKGLMKQSAHPLNGFFLRDTDDLINRIHTCSKQQQKVLLIGVTFALLDLAEKLKEPLPHVTVIETGGMKGRRKEITRTQLHETLFAAWKTPNIHSEYGMTEMLSQCYAAQNGRFVCPPWVKIIGRQTEDLLTPAGFEQTCVLGIIDLANVASCSFLLSEDLGKVYADGSFEVLGRMDNAEIRGCNLMMV